MATFSKSTEITAQFDNGDIRSMYLSTGNYSCYIQATTRNDETLKIAFSSKDEMHKFINAVLTMGIKLPWDEKYASESNYMTEDEMVTTDQVVGWKRVVDMQDVV